MYKCKKCESNEYVKAGFVRLNSAATARNVAANLYQHGIKEEANKKNSLQFGCVHTIIRSETSPSFLK